MTRWDLPELVLKRFGTKGWQQYDDLLKAGEITTEECVRKQYAMISARGRKEILDYVNEFWAFRPGAKELVSGCERGKTALTIVSAGLDFCIEAAFRANNARLPELVCPKTTFVRKKGFKLAFPSLGPLSATDFKETVVVSRKKMNDAVIFVGDGAGDLHAAASADEVFAIEGSELDQLCTQRGVRHRSIRTLFPVLRFIQGLS